MTMQTGAAIAKTLRVKPSDSCRDFGTLWPLKESGRPAILKMLRSELGRIFASGAPKDLLKDSVVCVAGGDQELLVLGDRAKFESPHGLFYIDASAIRSALQLIETHGEGDHMAGRGVEVITKLVVEKQLLAPGRRGGTRGGGRRQWRQRGGRNGSRLLC